MLQMLALGVSLLLVLIEAARYHVMGPQDSEQMIRLKSQYDIGPSTLLSLPIDVPVESISLYGKLPPRLKSITSTAGNEVFGTGDTVYIDLTYTSDVVVVGTPTLTLNTGCTGDDCTTKEIQAFVCQGDSGSFAMALENEKSPSPRSKRGCPAL